MPTKSAASSRRRPGRPPSGPTGEKVSEFPKLTIRLPHETKAALTSLSALRRVPVWALVDTAVQTYLATLPADERRLVARFAAKRLA